MNTSERNSPFLHHHMYCTCRIWIDGKYVNDSTLTATVLFDIRQQKNEHGRQMLVKPILMPLEDIAQDDLEEAAKISGFNPENVNIPSWKAFSPEAFDLLCKKYDLFGLLEKGQAILPHTKP